MVNILVPTDLSDLSKIAADYAIKIANKLDANVTLLHVLRVVSPVRFKLQKQLKALEKELISKTELDMIRVMKPVARHAKFSDPLRYHVAIGSPFEKAVKKEARKLRSGLIIMGTHGASGLKKVVLGSNTTSMIAISAIPVLAVPEDATFRGFRNIVYATDMRNLKKELKLLIPYAEIFGSCIHIIHVAASGKDVADIEEKMEQVIEKCGYDKIVNIVLADTDIDDAIAQYVSINKADLLAMFTHNPTFYEKLFDRSCTRRMAFHSRVPLLAFKGVMRSGF
jgi:nucleotide-binding universal stress UspA family protein